MIISPISYPGNKSKVLNELIPELNTSSLNFIDVFAGSGLVAINTKYKNLYCNDLSKPVIDLLKYFYYTPTEEILKNTEMLISKYKLTYSRVKPKGYYKIYKYEGLSNYNREGFLRLRENYNNKPSSDKLFVLLIYSFNHYIRFNSKGKFNVPVGKVDFTETTYKNTIEFSNHIKTKEVNFSNFDFREEELYNIDDSIFYFDPPYLITNAPYNSHWNINDEKELLNKLDELNKENKKFVLSNVLKSNGKNNDLLIEWSQKYNIVPIQRQYRNANYRRKNKSDATEVIIKNF
ncbi:DNA adenine methylase [Acholeplasma laidlawii]|uniref:DNA adenine methylase n=1 Tax=Acholeplasma laidlawii TaxID=2148 RepID=UPI0018C2CEEB|nr:DNA adenine methylase [Acholeplasma laidlawii]MBG0762775.1 DNA adenine methylase [Acholeplasma laidlawii]